MKDFIKTDKFILAMLILIASFGIYLFWGKQGHLTIDWGRELLISEQVSEGLILYKDIFNIYGPFAYQLNAILFKLFGAHTNTLYVFGAFVSLLITAGVYLLSREFSDKKMSAAITLFAIFTGIYKDYIFNFTTPYSYNMTYALCAFVYSLIALTKYNKTGKAKYAYWAAFLAGICISCKYEFAFYPLILLFNFIWLKPLGIKKFLTALVCLIALPCLSFGALILQGLCMQDITNTIKIFTNITKSPSLKYFYAHGAGGGIFTFLLNPSILLMFYIITMLYSKRKNLNENLPVTILCTSAVLFALKNFLTPDITYYGVYFLPVLILAAITLLNTSERKIKGAVIAILLITSFLSAFSSWDRIKILKYEIKTEKGAVSAASPNSSGKILIKIIEEKTEKTDKTVILPEGQLINFLSDRKSDSFYNNLIPMYIDTFGEDRIIAHYKANPPDYIIINDRDSSEYGAQLLCINYAEKLCSWIFDNYHVTYRIKGEPFYTFFRKN